MAFLIYRGNPRCGGQGVYTRHLTRELVALGYKVSDLGNAAGAIFRGNEYVTKVEGVTVRSKRAGRRGSVIGVYSSNTYESNPYVYPDTWARAYNEAK